MELLPAATGGLEVLMLDLATLGQRACGAVGWPSISRSTCLIKQRWCDGHAAQLNLHDGFSCNSAPTTWATSLTTACCRCWRAARSPVVHGPSQAPQFFVALPFDDLMGESHSDVGGYSRASLANVMFRLELQERLAAAAARRSPWPPTPAWPDNCSGSVAGNGSKSGGAWPIRRWTPLQSAAMAPCPSSMPPPQQRRPRAASLRPTQLGKCALAGACGGTKALNAETRRSSGRSAKRTAVVEQGDEQPRITFGSKQAG